MGRWLFETRLYASGSLPLLLHALSFPTVMLLQPALKWYTLSGTTGSATLDAMDGAIYTCPRIPVGSFFPQ